jgi:hypothetical protein
MKIQIGFRDEVKATAEASGDGEITWSGGGAGEARRVASFYARRASGEALLRLLVARLSGQWWAAEVGEGDARPAG